MILDTEPTRQQLDDRSFWDSLPPDGAICDGYEYAPMYSIMKNGEPLKFKTSDNKELYNAFPYEMAVKQLKRLSQYDNNLSMKITGYSQSFIRTERRLTT